MGPTKTLKISSQVEKSKVSLAYSSLQMNPLSHPHQGQTHAIWKPWTICCLFRFQCMTHQQVKWTEYCLGPSIQSTRATQLHNYKMEMT